MPNFIKQTNHRISGLASVRDRLSIQTITFSMQTRCGDEASRPERKVIKLVFIRAIHFNGVSLKT
jgi:hypothetical protein